MTIKCAECCQFKAPTEYYFRKYPGKEPKLRQPCKRCCIDREMARYKRHKRKIKAKRKAYRLANPLPTKQKSQPDFS